MRPKNSRNNLQTVNDYFEELKTLIKNKLKLDKENLKNTHEYQRMEFRIDFLMGGLTFNQLDLLQTLANVERERIKIYFASDIEEGQFAHLESELSINSVLKDYISERLTLKKEMKKIANSKLNTFRM